MAPQPKTVQSDLPLQIDSARPKGKARANQEAGAQKAPKPRVGASGFDLSDPEKVHRVPANRIQEDQNYNIRQDLGKIEEFASSLLNDRQEIHLEQPLVLRYRGGVDSQHNFVVKHGHRRMAGIRHLLQHHEAFKGKTLKDILVRAFIVDESTPGASAGRDIISQYRHNNGKPLSQMELVGAIADLRRGPNKLTDDEIRTKLGISSTALRDALLLTRLSSASTALIRSGRITPSLAGEFARRFPAPQESEAQLVEADRVAAAAAKKEPFDWAAVKRYGPLVSARKAGIDPVRPPYRIKPRHSKALLAARKATEGTKSGGRKKPEPTAMVTRTVRPAVIKRTEQIRAFLSVAPSHGEHPFLSMQRKTVLTLLDCLEQKKPIAELLQALGYPPGALSDDALATKDEESVRTSVVTPKVAKPKKEKTLKKKSKTSLKKAPQGGAGA